ncbi:N-acetylglucosaminyl-phosphatidylinositol de-N-acetylase-like [Arctopsyche grandis]|uniref:N-acetylglucosaminyl-phosphatidylinositol de-N-acetylase-like n=1 Tax=Arctopsyche grandis TaxID=121162 RepID=UPI00406D7A02
MSLIFDKNTRIFLLELYEGTVKELNEYFKHAATSILLFILGYIVVSLVIYKWQSYKERPSQIFKGTKRVLLVTAHPDDECMFFGPTIVNLARQGIDIYLLCLSNGNFYKQGNVRRLELYDACSVLNIKKHCIYLCVDESMPDSSSVRWPSDHVSNIILNYIVSLSIDAVITFDKGGISHHLNHTSIFFAMARLCIEKRFPEECKFFTLDTVNILRKYWGYLDLLLSFIFSSHWFVLSWKDSRIITRAMKKHKSQMVWFRYLYLLFSRYISVNTLRHITLTDLELDLQLDD